MFRLLSNQVFYEPPAPSMGEVGCFRVLLRVAGSAYLSEFPCLW